MIRWILVALTVVLVGCSSPVNISPTKATAGRYVSDWNDRNRAATTKIYYLDDIWIPGSGLGISYYYYYLVVNYGWVTSGTGRVLEVNASIAISERGPIANNAYDGTNPLFGVMGDSVFKVDYKVWNVSTALSGSNSGTFVEFLRSDSPVVSTLGSTMMKVTVTYSSAFMRDSISPTFGLPQTVVVLDVPAPSPVTVTATTPDSYRGTVSPSAAASTYIGQAAPLSAIPTRGFAFSQWSITSGSGTFAKPSAAQTTFTPISGNAVVSGIFVATPTDYTGTIAMKGNMPFSKPYFKETSSGSSWIVTGDAALVAAVSKNQGVPLILRGLISGPAGQLSSTITVQSWTLIE